VIRAAIVGGTGYGGMELLRLLLGHPEVELDTLTSRSQTGPVADAHPHLRGLTELRFTQERAAELAAVHDVLFFATPHGVAAKEAREVLGANPAVRLIDLSGDFRLRDPGLYAEHYGREHADPALLEQAVYGVPECGARPDLAGARLVANPGCHAYATLLALWPLQREGLIAGRVGVCSVTGSSGSGATPAAGTHHPERFANFKAYKPLRHQHVPEIEAALARAGQPAAGAARGVRTASPPVRIDFVPHSAPLARGIHVTAFVPVPPGREAEAVDVLHSTYEGEPFVRVLRGGQPELRGVVGSNYADLAATPDDGLLCVTAVIDNLVKGMAGTAVQNMNLVCGLDERTGLRAPGLGL